MQRKLLTSQEFTDAIPESINLDQRQVDNAIFQVEQGTFLDTSNCLGKDYYDALFADLSPKTGAIAYQSNVIYNTGDLVLYNGVYYDCIQTTTAPQYQRPDNVAFFQKQPKFTTAANNDLWEFYLTPLLAHKAAFYSFPMIVSKLTANGLVREKSDSYQPATSAEIAHKRSGYETMIQLTLDNMKSFLRANIANYPLTVLAQEQSKGGCENGKCDKQPKRFLNNLFGGLR